MMVSPVVALVGWLLFKNRDSGNAQISIVAMGETLTVGNVDGGVITQPTYDWEKVKVDKPPSKIVFKTASKHIDGDTTKPKIKYGVVYYSADDDGRRTYTYIDANGEEAIRNATVLPYANEGYYMVHYVKDATNHGIADPYGGTGIKDWFLKTPDNRGYADDKDAAIAKAKEWHEAKTEPNEPTTPPDDDGTPFNPQPTPQQPLTPLGGSMGMESAKEVVAGDNSVEEPAIIDIQETVIIEPITVNTAVGGAKTTLFGNRMGGF